jgi:hypothetical protein
MDGTKLQYLLSPPLARFRIFLCLYFIQCKGRSLSCINCCSNLFLSTTDLPRLFPYIFCSGSVP